MSETITWLHISDTHFCNKKNGWDSEEIIDSFFDDLKRMKSEYNLYPDLIFFTGDVALGHFNDSCGLSLRDQYEEANEFLERIREIFPKIPISNIFIVPGNHDVNRTLVGEGQTKWLKSLLINSPEIGRRRINELITENNVDWKRCMERLNDYRDFLKNSGYQHLLQDPDRLTYSIICDINGFNVGIAGLNSAWSSYGGDEDKANLLLGTYQISEARNKLKETMLSIAIVHHPPNWFTNFEDPKINREIERNFNFHLHGHEHQDWVMPIEKHIRIAAGALYNSSEQKNGYNFIRLYPSENRGEVFLRTYNNGVWVPNIIGNKTNNDGIWNLESLNINIKKKENIINSKSDVGVHEPAEKSTPEITAILDENIQKNDSSSKTLAITKDFDSTPVQILPPQPAPESKATISNVPYSRNTRFTGREDKLKQIHEALLSDNTVAVSQPIAVCGLGGIGKTQTAVEYTYRYCAEYEFIFWVKADSEDSIISGYVDIAKLLNLPVKNDSDQNNIVSAVLNWFRTHEKWLLVLDNADDTSFVKNYLPPEPKGHILLTSRAQVFDALEITGLVEMEEMSPDEAKSFLLKRTVRSDLHQSEFEALEKLVHELGYLPLALEQAGAYIYANNSSFKDYLVSYNKRGLKLLEKSPIDKSKYPESISTTWLMNFEEVNKKSEVSADVLFASAYLNPHEIPAEIFYKGADELGPSISAEFDEIDTDPLVFDEVLNPLWQYSLINRETGCRNYDIHRLVQAVLRDGMEKSEQKLWAERVVKAVNRAFPEVEYKNWELCDKLLPHAQTCAEYIGLWDIENEESAKLLNSTGSYLHKRARFKESESLLKSSLEIREKVLEPEHFDISESLNNLGEL
ncbi:MAG: metallophosphoesterase, partial [Methanosarcina sp.]|nr:metallophosphoesterase [Methanosarcina sp.]